MHVLGGFGQKVHYSAVFGDGKNKKRLSTQRRREKIGGRSVEGFTDKMYGTPKISNHGCYPQG
jgi:hypothetical protein